MLVTYPDTFENKIGFDQIRRRLAAECLGQAGQAYCFEGKISTKPGVVTVWLEQVAEYLTLLQNQRDLLHAPYPNLELLALRYELEGGFLNEEELASVQRLLVTQEQIVAFGRGKNAETTSQLKRLVAEVVSLGPVLSQINRALGEDGKLRDSASTELQRLRAAMVEEQRHLRRKLDQILRQALYDGYAPDGAEITIRGGRLVIPILSENKRRFKGFVHDESSTGQTVFMEPADILEGNNRVRELAYEERREVQRILTQLTSVIRQHSVPLQQGYKVISLLDFIRAKARYALATRSTKPVVNRERKLVLRQARNPLLEEILVRQGKANVPLDAELDTDRRILIISGPNAGGKSVALKTVGLLQYMVQFGLMVPASEDCMLPVFERLFVDIGDDQSLENDLSTYSSHLAHMRRFLQDAKEGSLVLIDEFGTGTDPAYGGPIAQAVLEELNRKQVFGIVTTHYSNLKELATRTDGLVNGSMRFDVESLTPLYKLQIGKPGSSFALEVATKAGLPKAMLSRAKELVGSSQINLDQTLASLEKERAEVDRLKKRLAEQNQLTEKLQVEYEQINAFLKTNRAALVRQAKEEAQGLLKTANQKIEQTIRDIREAEADKELTRELRQDLKGFSSQLELSEDERVTSPSVKNAAKTGKKDKAASKEAEPVVLVAPIAIGSQVRLVGSQAIGVVEAINGTQARVQIGNFSSTLKVNQLEHVSAAQTQQVTAASRGIDINARAKAFSPTLDLRGYYAGDALNALDGFMDDAMLLGQSEVQIIHGKGNGILRQQVRNQLKQYPQIASVRYDHPDRGGEGVSIVTFA